MGASGAVEQGVQNLGGFGVLATGFGGAAAPGVWPAGVSAVTTVGATAPRVKNFSGFGVTATGPVGAGAPGVMHVGIPTVSGAQTVGVSVVQGFGGPGSGGDSNTVGAGVHGGMWNLM